ncbi:MAG: hypothetical protein U9N04_02345, partial [Patescibacteria group bacterium]|nr:hypothetical protein [Patescibacteria group bacterium]
SFQTSNLYRSLNDYKVYSLEEIDETAIKHHLNLTAEEFEKEYDWNGVFEVNKEERDYYREGRVIHS